MLQNGVQNGGVDAKAVQSADPPPIKVTLRDYAVMAVISLASMQLALVYSALAPLLPILVRIE